MGRQDGGDKTGQSDSSTGSGRAADLGRSAAGAGAAPGVDALGLLFADNPHPMWVYDREDLTFLAVNDAAVATYGYQPDEFLSMTIADIRPPTEQARLREDVVLPRPAWQRSGPWYHRVKSGSLIEVEITSHETVFDGRPAVLVSSDDVTDRNNLRAQVRRLQESDPLTGLANRGALLADVDRLVARAAGAGMVCFLHLDLDFFNALNDSHGYQVGDRVLKQVAEVLSSFRPATIGAARLGADEFAVAARVPSRSDTVILAEQLRAALAENLRPPATTTVTVGIALAETVGVDAEVLLRDATVATRWAKRHRRGGVAVADEAFADQAVQRIATERALRAAIPAGELVVHYQPVVAVAEGRIVGAEALIRWNRPGHGLILPGQFIPLAEDTGLIADIWHCLLQEALGRTARWQSQANAPLSLALNLSARQLDDPSTVDHFASPLEASGIDPADVVVEVTETAAVADPDRMHEILSALRTLQVRVALDDFGTGYSSLAYLERTPFDIVKIDRTFISRLPIDRRQRSIVSGVVKLAHTLGMTVVAEGVETPEQLDQLARVGVDLAQGYYLGRPVDAGSFEAILATPHNQPHG
jgi:diguanylate cyclase (GGDEF)-like protein/PAS domain S-box-containing protein